MKRYIQKETIVMLVRKNWDETFALRITELPVRWTAIFRKKPLWCLNVNLRWTSARSLRQSYNIHIHKALPTESAKQEARSIRHYALPNKASLAAKRRRQKIRLNHFSYFAYSILLRGWPFCRETDFKGSAVSLCIQIEELQKVRVFCYFIM